MKFKGKVSWWFYAVMIGVAALLLLIVIVGAFVDTNICCTDHQFGGSSSCRIVLYSNQVL